MNSGRGAERSLGSRIKSCVRSYDPSYYKNLYLSVLYTTMDMDTILRTQSPNRRPLSFRPPPRCSHVAKLARIDNAKHTNDYAHRRYCTGITSADSCQAPTKL